MKTNINQIIEDCKNINEGYDFSSLIVKHTGDYISRDKFLDWFSILWKYIPEEHLYPIYQELLSDIHIIKGREWYKDFFKPEIISKIMEYNKDDTVENPELISLLDNNGFITVYHAHCNRTLRDAHTWALNKEEAVDQIPDFEKRVSITTIHSDTIKKLLKGGNTTKDIANKVSLSLNMSIAKIFDAVDTDKKLSSVTISHYHRLISAMLTTAVQWQLILSNPCERVKPPKVERKEANYYNIYEVNKLLDLLEKEHVKHRVMIHIVLFCGLRQGELTDLEWSDIDFENETISISKQLQYLPKFGTYELDSVKSESGNRTISMPTILADLLKEYKTWQDGEKSKWGERWVDSDKLFTQEDGKPIFPETPSKWFNKFIKRKNLPPLTFHQLRHTNASLLIGEGVDIATVSNRLGHAKVEITLKTYTHAIKEHDREASDKLQKLLKKKD